MKSRTILKYQYDCMGTFLCDTYIKKNHLMEKKAETQKKISDIMADELPDIVKQAYQQYPDYFELKKRSIYTVFKFIEANTSQYDPEEEYSQIKRVQNSYADESIEFANYIYDSLKKLDLIKYYGSKYFGYQCSNSSNIYSMDFVGIEISKDIEDNRYSSYNDKMNAHIISKYALNHPKVKEIILEYIIEVIKYEKFRKDISCAFSTITTTNMLKNEIPEAYDFFYKNWGKEYEEQDKQEKDRKKTEKKAQCDKIEALRASIS